jgi:tetratricopeptide (TPR) repeat protein
MVVNSLLKSPLFALILITAMAGAQSNLDSLRKLLPQTDDQQKLKIHNQLSEALWRANKLKPALEEAEIALSLATKSGNVPGMIAALENFGMASKNAYKEKISYLQRALALAEQNNDLEGVVRISINIAQTFAQPNNNNQRALEFYLKALDVNKKLGDKKFEARALSGVGWVYKSSKKYDLALASYEKALALCLTLGEGRTAGWTYIACAAVHIELGDYGKALAHCQPALDQFESTKDSSGIASSLYRIGEVVLKQEKWNDAVPYLNRSFSISKINRYGAYIAITSKLLGNAYAGLNQNQKALEFYLRSLEVAQRLHMYESVSEVSRQLARIYKDQGDYKKALVYQQLYSVSNDSVFNQEKNRQLTEMQARFETENKENEIKTLKKDQHINKIYGITGMVVFVLVLVISVLIINHQRLKAKKNGELVRKERLLLENIVARQKLEEEKLRFTIDHNNKSLTAYTLNLIHKNELLDDIKAQVQQIRILPEPELRTNLNSLLKTVNYSIHLDKDWDNFKHHFEQVHQGFFDKLKENYPDLSPYDLRLCSLVKLNLETKQIATLLDISIESAKVARSRIRKKMGLQQEQNLQEFLQAF